MRKWRSFIEAREYARGLGLKGCREWWSFCKIVGQPIDIPRCPDLTYKNEGWIGYRDWVGMEFRPFEEAREFARGLGLKKSDEWFVFAKTDKKPKDIPVSPAYIYKDKGWIGMRDWLGTEFRPFKEAREFVRSLGLPSQAAWEEYSKSTKRPNDIHSNPQRAYKNKGWINYRDWLGFEVVSRFKEFEEAREFVRSLGLNGTTEWRAYTKTDKKPKDIPIRPEGTYKDKGWIGMRDWLGTEFRPFEEARKFVHKLNLYGIPEWKEFTKSEEMPFNIPCDPSRVYKNQGWNGYRDWLGTKLTNRRRKYRVFDKAREFVHSLKLSGEGEWRIFSKSDKRPDDIPATPHSVYKNKGWINWGDWLGTYNIGPLYRKELYRSFEEARNYALDLKLQGDQEWREYSKAGKLPNDIPSHPERVYKDQWKGIHDWLGYNHKNISFGQECMSKLLNDIFRWNNVYEEYGSRKHGFYYSETGGNMPFDVAIPELGVYFEFQGRQHFKMIDIFGGIKGYFRRKRCDEEKRFVCNKNGITLIEIPYTWDRTEKNLRERIREAGVSIPCGDFTS